MSALLHNTHFCVLPRLSYQRRRRTFTLYLSSPLSYRQSPAQYVSLGHSAFIFLAVIADRYSHQLLQYLHHFFGVSTESSSDQYHSGESEVPFRLTQFHKLDIIILFQHSHFLKVPQWVTFHKKVKTKRFCNKPE